MAMRDETRKESAQADIESLERLLKETLAQPLTVKGQPRPTQTDNAPDLFHVPPPRKNQISLEVPSLQLDGFRTPPAHAHTAHEVSTIKQPSQNEHKVNFEAAMAQLSMIIDPSGHKNRAEAEKNEGKENSLHMFFEDEFKHEQAEAATKRGAHISHAPSLSDAEAMPFAVPPPYSVPDIAGDMSYSEKLLFEATQDFASPRMNQVENADRFSLPPGYAAPLNTLANHAETYNGGTSQKALDDVEARLAEEVAKVAAGSQTQTKRSYRVLGALVAIAAFGIVSLISVSLLNGRTKPQDVRKDGIPVIAAKTLPTKEKPENPGGIEIPDQNMQVLSTRTQLESKPAQVLNTTEQPVDLTQITKKEPVRVVLPNPTAPQEGAGNNPQLEPKRVSSVRLGGSGVQPTPVTPPASSPTSVPTLTSPVSQPQKEGLAPAPRTVYPPPMPMNAAKAAAAPVEPPAAPPAKVESRPDLPAPPAARPVSSATPSAPVNTAPPALRTTTNGPLVLTQQQRNSAPPAPAAAPRVASTSATGAYAIQLASRPSESNAREALSQVRTRYAGSLGGKPLSVVSGEVNGQAVYRVRAIGYSQAEAEAACNQIKSAGGSCFVTKQ